MSISLGPTRRKVETYRRAWSVPRRHALYILVRRVNPSLDPGFFRGFVSFLSLLLGSLDYSVSVVREYRLIDDRFLDIPPS